VYEASEGCRSCRLLRDRDDPKTFLIIEIWDGIEARDASAKKIPGDVVEEAVQLSARPPNGRTFVA
jgi:quinol monooxygenase YgiN